jgi:hypothetical protein
VTDPLDENKPEIKENEMLCGGCWTVDEKKAPGWLYFGFKYLESLWLCPECIPKMGPDLSNKQRAGL